MLHGSSSGVKHYCNAVAAVVVDDDDGDDGDDDDEDDDGDDGDDDDDDDKYSGWEPNCSCYEINSIHFSGS